MEYKDKKQAVLEAIFADDPMDLLQVRAAVTPARTTDDRLIAAFQEIVAFWEKHHRLPSVEGGIQEHQFLSRLRNLQSDPRKVNLLQDLDVHGLLKMELPPIENTITREREIDSLDDIFTDNTFSFFDDDTAAELFDLKHVGQASDRAEADFVAQRKPCKDFEQYETVFKAVQKDLAGGKRKLLQFKEDNLREGKFYVHNGILLLLQEAAIEEKEEEYRSGGRTRKDGRTRVIFENGTESNMLYRSLYKALLANGKAVSDHEYEVNEELAKNFGLVTEADQESGYIYILQSKSQNPEIKALKNLYKIGYSTMPVMERIKNAAKEPTYLMAEVELISVFKCYNLNAQRFEQLLQIFFAEVCLDIDIFDHKRARRRPREWFIAPLPVIQRVIEMIVSGEIVGFRYNAMREEIETR